MTPEQKAHRLDRLRWRYHNDPAYRARVLEQQRAYRALPSYKEAERARKRRWIANADPEHIKAKNRQYHVKSYKNPVNRAAAVRRVKAAKMRARGLTLEQIDQMILDQEGVCLICHRTNGSKALVVDHDHVTGQARALLCGSCNTGLGLFQDDPYILERAKAYLDLFHWRRNVPALIPMEPKEHTA